ncbi:MAG: prepilin peptidase [Chloroflexota bacterium]|nr:prepilin peptidase [Chloroflexota bacterium]
MAVLFSIATIILGLLVGFMINVVSTRLSANRPILGPFRCTRSPHGLAWWQMLPLVGYVVQGGRCRTCGKSISAAYPLAELLVSGLYITLLALNGWSWTLPFLLQSVYVAFLVIVLVIDWKHRDIYLSIIGLGSLVALVGSMLLPGVGIVSALIGAAVAGGFFALAFGMARLIFPHIEEPLGQGDVFLALMMGLMLGFPNIVGALLIGPLLAGAAALLMLVSRRSKLGDFMPYGVALCAATMLFLIYPAPFAEALRLPALMTVLAGLFQA